MKDTQKILQILRACGDKGIHSFDLNNQAGTFRAAARILDLKKEGYNITATPETKGNARGVRYVLHETPKPEVKLWDSLHEREFKTDPKPVQQSFL